jgi:hypothetical protein
MKPKRSCRLKCSTEYRWLWRLKGMVHYVRYRI